LGRKSVGVLRRAAGGRRGGQRVGAVASEGRGTRRGHERREERGRRGEDRIGAIEARVLSTDALHPRRDRVTNAWVGRKATGANGISRDGIASVCLERQ
jgi:hypothetical protein